MKTAKTKFMIALSAAITLGAGLSMAEISQETIDSISTPNEVKTSIGTSGWEPHRKGLIRRIFIILAIGEN